jgi:hypothetical protein
MGFIFTSYKIHYRPNVVARALARSNLLFFGIFSSYMEIATRNDINAHMQKGVYQNDHQSR